MVFVLLEPPMSTANSQLRGINTIGSRHFRFGPSDVLAFLIPSLAFLEIGVIGRLFIPEIILLGLLPLLLYARGRWLWAPLPRKLLLFGTAWLAAQIITDLVRSTPFQDWTRGWAKITFFLLNFSALYLFLMGRRSRILWFAAGIVCGQILSYFIAPNMYAAGNTWKFGVGGAVTLAIALFTQTAFATRRPLMPELMLAGSAALNILMGLRSLGAVCFVAALYLFGRRLFARLRPHARNLGMRGWAVVVVAALVSGIAIKTTYEYAASQGWLGGEALAKYESQSSGELGILIGGRKEILASGQAILDSPLIGHGSWAKNRMYIELLLERLSDLGYGADGAYGEDSEDLIPTHSYLFGAWVEAGLMGAVFWAFVALLSVRCLGVMFTFRHEPLVAFGAFIAVSLTWDILFSPFGALTRLYVPYYLVLLMFLLKRHDVSPYGAGPSRLPAVAA